MEVSELTKFYQSFLRKVLEARCQLSSVSLTFAEKILLAHVVPGEEERFSLRQQGTMVLHPDRVAMQDATAQMAVLQFMQAGKSRVAVPTTVHCDHLIRAHTGAAEDLVTANSEHGEVYDFLRSAAAKYGMGFWQPGAGIIHQVILENYAVPGMLAIGTDSHTPNAGGMGMLAIGVGGADAADVMAGLPWTVPVPKVIGVHLTGELSGWTTPKDVILRLLEILTVKGGTGCIVEYFGPGVESISATGRATITNMGAELGATTSVFPVDHCTVEYLRASGRKDAGDVVEEFISELCADNRVLENPELSFDRVIEIDLSELEPYVVGPHSPDRARPLSKFAAEARQEGFPLDISSFLIGSCTNSSYEDIGLAAAIAEQALTHGISAQAPLLVSPGSTRVFRTIDIDGLMRPLIDIGAEVLANACGPCIGQWKRDGDEGPNSILTSFNRNFPARNDGNRETHAFIASPVVVAAMALSGRLDFNPMTDSLSGSSGETFQLEPPKAASLPPQGLLVDSEGLIEPPEDGSSVTIVVSPTSERLQLLEPFQRMCPADFQGMPILLKAAGKCTTDHISPAGPWLRFRGHLDRISNNMFVGANNVFSDEPGTGLNLLTKEDDLPLSAIARDYKAKGESWVAVGDENYGEGSSREHAAMSPRYLGCKVVVARSFARIHETNLKKQGILPLTFENPSDYDVLEATDRISIPEVASIQAGEAVLVTVCALSGSEQTIRCQHSLTTSQLEWFRAGAALNLLREE